MTIIKYTISDRATDNRVIPVYRKETSWDELVKRLSNFTITDNKKKDVKMVVPVEFKEVNETTKYAVITPDEAKNGAGIKGDTKIDENGIPYVWKGNTNIKNWYMLVLDIDGEMSIEDAKYQFKDYEYVMYTSHSHQSDEKPYDCFRVIIPFDRHIPNEEFLKRIRSIEDWVDIDKIDRSSLASYRAFYLPSCPKERRDKAVFIHNKGKLLDVWAFDEYVEPEPDTPKVEYKCEDEEKQILLDLLCQAHEQIHFSEWGPILWGMKNSGFTLEEAKIVHPHFRRDRLTGPKADDVAQNWSNSNSEATIASVIHAIKTYVGGKYLKPYYDLVDSRPTKTEKTIKNDIAEAFDFGEDFDFPTFEAKDILESFSEDKRTLTTAPTGSGKSYSTCLKSLALVKDDPTAKVAIIVPSKSHIEQIVSTFMKLLNTTNVNQYGIDYFVSGGSMLIGESKGTQTFTENTRIGITHFAYAARKGFYDRYYNFFEFIDNNTHVFIDEVDAYIEALTTTFQLGARYKERRVGGKLTHSLRTQCGMSVGGTNCAQCVMKKYANRHTFDETFSIWKYGAKVWFDSSEHFDDNDYFDLQPYFDKKLKVADTIEAYTLKQKEVPSDMVIVDHDPDHVVSFTEVVKDYLEASWRPTVYRNFISLDGSEVTTDELREKFFVKEASSNGLVVINDSVNVKFPKGTCNTYTVTTMDRRPLLYFNRAASLHMITATISDLQQNFLRDLIPGLKMFNVKPTEERKMDKVFLIGSTKKFNEAEVLGSLKKSLIFKETKSAAAFLFDELKRSHYCVLANDQSDIRHSRHHDINVVDDLKTMITHARGNLGRGIDMYQYNWVFCSTNAFKPTCAFVVDDEANIMAAIMKERANVVLQNIGRILRKNPNGDDGIRYVFLNDLLDISELEEIANKIKYMTKRGVETIWLHSSVSVEKRHDLFRWLNENNEMPEDHTLTFDAVINQVRKLVKQGVKVGEIKKQLGIDKEFKRHLSKDEKQELKLVLSEEVDEKEIKQQKRLNKIQELLDKEVAVSRIKADMKVRNWSVDEIKWFDEITKQAVLTKNTSNNKSET